MSNVITSVVVLACLCGGIVAGMLVQAALPRHHLDDTSKGTVLLGTGLVVTMSALVLGLLVSSAYSYFDAQRVELTEISSSIVMLDRVLAHYGPEATEGRELVRVVAAHAADRIFSERREAPPIAAEDLFTTILKLTPRDEAQRVTRDEALRLVTHVGRLRWLAYEQRHDSLPTPLLVVVVGWLTLIYFSFGLFAPTNGTVVISLSLSALSVSAAILLILEMYSPFTGLIRLSNGPIRAALEQLGR